MTMSDDLDWKRWFKLKGQAPIVRREFSAEEMYQAFKARLIEEQQEPQVQGEPDGYAARCNGEWPTLTLRKQAMNKYTLAIGAFGPSILKDGQPLTLSDVVSELNCTPRAAVPDGDAPTGNFAFLGESRECGIYSDDGRLLAKAMLDEKVHAALLSTVDACTLVASAHPNNVRQDDGS